MRSTFDFTLIIASVRYIRNQFFLHQCITKASLAALEYFMPIFMSHTCVQICNSYKIHPCAFILTP